MDVFVEGDTLAGMTLDARAGGSPFNTAIGLARLGQPAALFAAISRDTIGERLLRSLEAEGVATGMVQRNDARTTLSLVALDATRVPRYSFYGESGADRLLTPDSFDAMPTAAAIHVGSYATVVEPIALTLRLLVERERKRVPIIYDPNVRLNVEPRLERWRVAFDWMLPRSQLVKISDEDLGLLHPGEPAEVFAARVLGQGAALVVVTRGSEGALAWSKGAHANIGRVAVEVVDTVGAGDSFEAALLTWLAEHLAISDVAMRALGEAELAAALQFATRAAAITCSRRGADLPYRAELN